MRTRINYGASAAVCAALVAFASGVFAGSPKTDCPPATKEEREKMAVIHEQMAACLRTDKAISVCHQEMMKSHEELMRATGCPEHAHSHPHQ